LYLGKPCRRPLGKGNGLKIKKEIMPLSLASLTRTGIKIYSWFNMYPPTDSTILDPWKKIMNPALNHSVDLFLHHFSHAAESTQEPVLEWLNVVWIWHNKSPGSPEHEYFIVETKDSRDGKTQLFIFDRTMQIASESAPRNPDHKRPDNSGYFENIQGIIHGLRRPPSLSSMEEGTVPSTPTSSYNLHPPQLSLGDALSLTSVETSNSISDSLDKGDKTRASDQVRGENSIKQPRFGCGQNARQLKPLSMGFFELILLTVVVHDYAPEYSVLDKNCYWFCNITLDAIVKLFELDNIEGDPRAKKYKILDPYNSEISGRRNGMKVHYTNQEDLSAIVKRFREAHQKLLSKVCPLFLFFF
jgi:hypothetical protein